MRIIGVEVRPRPSYLLLGVATAVSEAVPLRDDLAGRSAFLVDGLAALIGLGLLLSVLLHELAHAAAARRLGLDVARIELSFWGGQTEIDEPRSAREQYLVSMAGPLVNVLLGGLAALVLLSPVGDRAVVHQLAQTTCIVNVLLAVYNLLPGLPLDGGQLVRAGVWARTGDKITGLRAAGFGGLLTAGLTVLLGCVILTSSYLAGFATVLLGMMVGQQALGAFLGAKTMRRLPSVIAGRLAKPAFLAVGDLPLAEARRRAAERGLTAVVLGIDGRASAVLSDALVARVPEERRPWVTLSSVSEPVAESLDAALTGEELLEAMRAHPAATYVVTSGGAIVGVLTTADVALSLRGKTA